MRAGLLLIALLAAKGAPAQVPEVESPAPDTAGAPVESGQSEDETLGEVDSIPEGELDEFFEADAPPDAFLADVNQEVARRQGALDDARQPAALDSEPSTSRTLYYLQVASKLCLVLALIVFVGFLARKFGRGTTMLAGPELGEVLGRVHLGKGAALHFVRTGGRVLLIGLTNNTMSLIADLDSSKYEEEELAPAQFDPDSFLAKLQENSQLMAPPPKDGGQDDEITALRNDIERLQRYLREEARDQAD